MNFNPETTKQAQEVIFSRKLKNVYLPLLSDNASVSQTSSQKHLGIILDNQLKLKDLIKMESRKLEK